MKTNDQQARVISRKRYLQMAFALVLFSSLFADTVSAQKRRGEGDNGTAREGTREQPAQRPERDIRRPGAASGNNHPARDFNRNANPVRIERNRDNTPAVRNTETTRNPNNPRIETNRNPNNGRPNNYNRPGNNNRPIVGTANRPGYRPVYGYNRRPHYNPHNPSWRYGYLPRRNSYFYSLPSTYLSINFGGIGYRYWDGVFYRPYNNLFTVIGPPAGIYINILPIGYRRIMVRNYPYYYYNGTYYDQRENNYYVVSPPVGAVVESLPAGYETVVIDGETYFTADGAQYKPVVQENAEIWYEVIKAN
ncbi:MAG: hypothetical protein IPP72_18125 [Chitinophagaceae bacterium]|nr:hypothetical protein [Chitinophagaceae bacterium]